MRPVPLPRPSRAALPVPREARQDGVRGAVGAVRRGLARGLGAGVGLALTAGVLSGVGTTGSGVQEQPTPVTAADLAPVAAAPASAPFRAFTLNVAFPLSVAQATADMRKAMTRLGASAGGFQEMSGKADRDAMIRLCNELGWGWYMPMTQGVTIPIVFDKARFQLLEGRSVRVHGALGRNSPSRWINTARLRERATGKVFGVINTHTIAQASRDAQASNPERIPYLRKHLAMLRAEILALFATTEHTVAMGDLNVNYLADRRRQVAGLPTRALGDLVSFDMPLVGSRGRTSLLDYVMSVKRDGGLAPTTTQVVRGFNSDHDAVVATYRTVDLFAEGPLTNAPNGGVHARRVVLDRWVRAIGDTEQGAVVRIATPRLDDAAVSGALVAAARRGVAVRLLLEGGARTAAEQQVEAELGSDQAAASWVRAVPEGRSKASFLLADRTGGTTALTIAGSTPADGTATSTLADALMTSNDRAYAIFLADFDDLAAGTVEPAPAAGRGVGAGYIVQSAPFVSGQDPVAQALRPIRCQGATGPRNARGRTKVRISVDAWGGARGLDLAERVAAKARYGCDVRVLAGPSAGAGVVRKLTRAGVRVKRVGTGQHLLLVDGRYGVHRNRQLSWSGTATWAPGGLTMPGHTVRVVGAPTLLAYAKQFDGRWVRG